MREAKMCVWANPLERKIMRGVNFGVEDITYAQRLDEGQRVAGRASITCRETIHNDQSRGPGGLSFRT